MSVNFNHPLSQLPNSQKENNKLHWYFQSINKIKVTYIYLFNKFYMSIDIDRDYRNAGMITRS